LCDETSHHHHITSKKDSVSMIVTDFVDIIDDWDDDAMCRE
jgi:hypothetical protein